MKARLNRTVFFFKKKSVRDVFLSLCLHSTEPVISSGNRNTISLHRVCSIVLFPLVYCGDVARKVVDAAAAMTKQTRTIQLVS